MCFLRVGVDGCFGVNRASRHLRQRVASIDISVKGGGGGAGGYGDTFIAGPFTLG
jgi:hypothetical protein